MSKTAKITFILLFGYVALVGLACSLTAPPAPATPPTPTAGNPTDTPQATSTATKQASLQTNELFKQSGLQFTPTTPPPTPATCEVKTGIDAGGLNLRTGPGVDWPVLEVLTEGERLEVLTAGDWAEVLTPSGQTGWVNSVFCR